MCLRCETILCDFVANKQALTAVLSHEHIYLFPLKTAFSHFGNASKNFSFILVRFYLKTHESLYVFVKIEIHENELNCLVLKAATAPYACRQRLRKDLE